MNGVDLVADRQVVSGCLAADQCRSRARRTAEANWGAFLRR
jgi:hypothetical protein